MFAIEAFLHHLTSGPP